MDWTAIPADKVIEQTVSALKKRNIQVIVVSNKREALAKLKELIPAGASVMTGGTTTLDEIGFTDVLKSQKHPWRNLKDAIFAEKDPAKQYELRRQSLLVDYFVASVQAIAQTGEVLNCDATGTRTGPYAYGPKQVIWVAGAQKIVADLTQAFRRMWEHCVPLEDQRMKNIGYPGTTVSRILIYEKADPGRITMILVKEKLGF
ncbi:MAG: lactate utilization protein [Chloroflexota bacterium]